MNQQLAFCPEGPELPGAFRIPPGMCPPGGEVDAVGRTSSGLMTSEVMGLVTKRGVGMGLEALTPPGGPPGCPPLPPPEKKPFQALLCAKLQFCDLLKTTVRLQETIVQASPTLTKRLSSSMGRVLTQVLFKLDARWCFIIPRCKVRFCPREVA